MPIRQSFCYPCFKDADTSFDTLCERAAAIGYAGIELWFRGDDFDDLTSAAARHGLVVASMCGHGTLTDGLNLPANHERIEAEVRESIAVASDLGIPNLICFTGNRNPGQPEADAFAAVVAGLHRIAPMAEAAGVTLNVELLNSKVDHPGYQCDHTAWGVAFCREVASPHVKLLYDIYHMQIMEGDIIRTIGEHLDHIGHFHTAGNPGRRDLDDEQELNYPAICRAISTGGFAGFVAHEFTPKGDRLEGLERAYRLCEV